MTQTHPKPEALISTPDGNAECPRCMGDWKARLDQASAYADWSADDVAEFAGPMPLCSRYPDNRPTFAHCDVCGSTDLLDTRSPFQVWAEALANVKAAEAMVEKARNTPQATSAVQTLFGRQDALRRVAEIAEQTSPGHCEDCKTWAVKVVLLRATKNFTLA